MFETIKRLYDGGNGQLSKVGVSNAVVKGWITSGQFQEITGESYVA